MALLKIFAILWKLAALLKTEFCKTFQKNYFEKHLGTAASVKAFSNKLPEND